MSQEELKTCFVIMPFTVRKPDLERYDNDPNHWDEVYAGLIVPAVKKAGLTCLRDDEDVAARLITEDIWRKIEQAEVILCDLSAGNPNVYLELGWSMRADKKFILIKDSLTDHNFDLNQYFALEYSHRLRPSILAAEIDRLADVIRMTLGDDHRRYSIVKKMSLDLRAIEASKQGNVEVDLINEVLREIKGLRGSGPDISGRNDRLARFAQQVTSSNIALKIVGTCWRKGNGIEVVCFRSPPVFEYMSTITNKWNFNDYELNSDGVGMRLLWKLDDYTAICTFSRDYQKFYENSDPKYTWILEWVP